MRKRRREKQIAAVLVVVRTWGAAIPSGEALRVKQRPYIFFGRVARSDLRQAFGVVI